MKAILLAVVALGACAFESPNAHFQTVMGCLQLPQHTPSDAAAEAHPDQLLPRPLR